MAPALRRARRRRLLPHRAGRVPSRGLSQPPRATLYGRGRGGKGGHARGGEHDHGSGAGGRRRHGGWERPGLAAPDASWHGTAARSRPGWHRTVTVNLRTGIALTVTWHGTRRWRGLQGTAPPDGPPSCTTLKTRPALQERRAGCHDPDTARRDRTRAVIRVGHRLSESVIFIRVRHRYPSRSPVIRVGQAKPAAHPGRQPEQGT